MEVKRPDIKIDGPDDEVHNMEEGNGINKDNEPVDDSHVSASLNRRNVSISRSTSGFSRVSSIHSIFSHNPVYECVFLLSLVIIIFIAGFLTGGFTVKYIFCDSRVINKEALEIENLLSLLNETVDITSILG